MKRKLFLLTLTAIFCTTTGCYRFTKSESYFGIKTEGKNVVFLVDVSGSMEGKNEGNVSDKLRAQAVSEAGGIIRSKLKGPLGGLASKSIENESTKLATARRELMPAIRGLDEKTKFTVLTFSSSINYWDKNVLAATDMTKNKAIFFVDNLKSGGGTSALAGLKAALNVRGVDVIFFLSDGQPSDASSDKILKEIKSLNNGRVIIHSVGLGDDKDEDFMKALADENNGVYTEK